MKQKKHRFVDKRFSRPVIRTDFAAPEIRARGIVTRWLENEDLPYLDRWLSISRDVLKREGLLIDTPAFHMVMRMAAMLWRDTFMSSLPEDTDEPLSGAMLKLHAEKLENDIPNTAILRSAARRFVSNTKHQVSAERTDILFEAMLDSGDPICVAAAFGIPHWFVPRLLERTQRSGISLPALCMNLVRGEVPPPVFARVNQEKNIDIVIAELKNSGFTVVQDGDLLRLEGPRSVFALPSFKNGLFEVQDRSSVRIGRACAAKPGEFLFDACAGNGGKTLLLAGQLGGKGAVLAADPDERKIHALKLRARHAGLADVVRTLMHDATKPVPQPREAALRGGFDLVLVDAPCTSSGTWKRNPDAMLRLDPRTIPDFPTLQNTILNTSARTVRDGGRLVYATCSFMAVENEDVVEKFLKDHPGFALVKSELYGLDGEGDVMFCAVMEKTPKEK